MIKTKKKVGKSVKSNVNTKFWKKKKKIILKHHREERLICAINVISQDDRTMSGNKTYFSMKKNPLNDPDELKYYWHDLSESTENTSVDKRAKALYWFAERLLIRDSVIYSKALIICIVDIYNM